MAPDKCFYFSIWANWILVAKLKWPLGIIGATILPVQYPVLRVHAWQQPGPVTSWKYWRNSFFCPLHLNHKVMDSTIARFNLLTSQDDTDSFKGEPGQRSQREHSEGKARRNGRELKSSQANGRPSLKEPHYELQPGTTLENPDRARGWTPLCVSGRGHQQEELLCLFHLVFYSRQSSLRLLFLKHIYYHWHGKVAIQ